ncbi:MAG: acyl-CoA thioesterase [Thermomicrobiales bacterium]|nr:acyl-CoA thioesterase [Thermomicrobiales bacterium]MCO5218635.1 acyl-CoA thioesterase [Thermomicrobiales bacterium]MCO5224312.1 acyl-CoA thioesterase [Thermomicrobiales bacterium]MCO5229051.1 acyl-CoA thioesterase [Thermomicrobiales bacterium]
MTQILTGYVAMVRVRFSECDPLGHVNNAVYLNYLEQAAIDHAAALGWSSAALTEMAGAVFVARKHEITYRQPAFENDHLLIRTWPTEMRGARGLRSYTISRFTDDIAGWVDRVVPFEELPEVDPKDLIVTADTEWAFMNVTTGRPSRIPEVVARDFVEG